MLDGAHRFFCAGHNHNVPFPLLCAQDRRDAFYRKYNANAALLRHALDAYEAYIKGRSGAGAGATGSGGDGAGASSGGGGGAGPHGMSHAGPPGISHELAAQQWHRLLRRLVHDGNFYLMTVGWLAVIFVFSI